MRSFNKSGCISIFDLLSTVVFISMFPEFVDFFGIHHAGIDGSNVSPEITDHSSQRESTEIFLLVLVKITIEKRIKSNINTQTITFFFIERIEELYAHSNNFSSISKQFSEVNQSLILLVRERSETSNSNFSQIHEVLIDPPQSRIKFIVSEKFLLLHLSSKV